MATTTETVRTDIEVNAKAALEQLKAMSRDASNAEEAIANFSSFLVTNSKRWNAPLRELRQLFRDLNAEIAKNKGQTLFGNFGNKKIFSGEESFTNASIAAGRLQVAQNGIVSSVGRGSKAMDEADRAARGYTGGINVLRTAMGTLTAVGIFTFLSALQNFFTEGVRYARELEDSMHRLANVERELSGKGIEITLKGLKDGITDLKKAFPIFSKEDLTGLVGGLAIKTKDLEYSEKQILDLAEAIAVLNVRSTEMEGLDQTTSKVVTALLSGSTKGISGLGLQMNDATIVAEAMAENLLQAGEGMSSLTKQEKDLVKLNIVLKSAGGELLSIQDYLETSSGIIQQNTASWKDFQQSVGLFFTAFTPLATPFFEFLTNGANGLKALAAIFTSVASVAKAFWATVLNPSLEFPKKIAEIKDFVSKIPELFNEILGKKTIRLFPEVPDNAPNWFKNIFGKFLEDADTVTNSAAAAANAIEGSNNQITQATIKAEAEIQAIMQEGRDKRADIDRQYREKIADANRDHAQKMADIARQTERKLADAQLNYTQKVEDINRDANEKIAEAQQDARQKELDREAEYQNKLRELRERFLFDLEDALRERDARQVLRLIREYNFDKKNLAEKHKLERVEEKKNLAKKLADIEQERQIKLEAARRELAEKQAEIALWAQREAADARTALARKLADARLWHQRELAEYNEYLKRKLQALAASIIKEYQLTAAGAAAIFSLLNGYFGASGAISGLLGQGLNTQLNGVLSSSSGSGGGAPAGFQNTGNAYYGMAQGGTMIATRPTTVTFGEAGPELASFKPIGRTGSDENKLFGAGTGGSESLINLKIALTDGLVAEIVETTLDGMAVHLDKIRREK